MADRTFCGSLTSKNKPCQNKAVQGKEFCRVHEDNPNLHSAAQEEIIKCGGVTAKGSPCLKRSPVKGMSAFVCLFPPLLCVFTCT